ncbi:extensin-1-like [Phragmites australis]|uniref:extensin-1-like n=1 Tax=Phragmites australis TaxID=29695 RepID=UPI002D77565E|nr:extensin-1-like [Phragmites australis]
MKMSMTGQPKGHLWMAFTMLFAIFTMHGAGATSFLPPSLSLSPTYAPVIKVVGKVYCYRCFNEAHPEESHGKKHLEGAMVKVTCQANDQALVGFGYTRSNGKYSVSLKGLPISNTYGSDSCKVELHAAPGGSDCNVPMELNLSGLSVYSKSSEELVLKANQIMAFASKKTFVCSKPHILPPMYPHSLSPPYQYPSPLSPLPYQYSPPPSNQFPPPAYQYPSPPQNYHPSPPPYQQSTPSNTYRSPPPPQGVKIPAPSHKHLTPPYYYKSPLLPSSATPPYHYNSPPPYQYSPPPYNYQSSPPSYLYSPPLPPKASKHLQPKAPHENSPPASSTSTQPLYQYNSLSPPNVGTSSTMPPLHTYQSPPPPNQLS